MNSDAALAWAVEAFKDGRNEQYERLKAYMDGEQELQFASDKFRTAFGRLFQAFHYNRCAVVVDAHADRMQVESFSSATDTAAAEAASVIWERNRMHAREGHAEVDAFGLGDSHIIAEVHPDTGLVHYWVQDPSSVRVKYSQEVPGERIVGAKAWQDADTGLFRVNMYHRDRIEKYVTTNVMSGMPPNPDAFVRYDMAGQPWSFRTAVQDTVPIFHIANNGRTGQYGVSELEPVIPLQNAINKTLMDMLVAMEFAAFPQKVLIGVEANETEREQIERFQVGIDRILTLFASDAKVAEFSAANIAQYIAVAEFWDMAISRVTKVPVHYLGMTGDFGSGVARRLAESPFTAKIEDRQYSVGQEIHDLQRYALRAEGMTNLEHGVIDVNWKPAAPIAYEEQLEIAMMQDTLGIPLEFVLEDLGMDGDRIKAIIESKRQGIEAAKREFNAGAVVPSLGDDDNSLETLAG